MPGKETPEGPMAALPLIPRSTAIAGEMRLASRLVWLVEYGANLCDKTLALAQQFSLEPVLSFTSGNGWRLP